jgi:hypothetical protein
MRKRIRFRVPRGTFFGKAVGVEMARNCRVAIQQESASVEPEAVLLQRENEDPLIPDAVLRSGSCLKKERLLSDKASRALLRTATNGLTPKPSERSPNACTGSR